MPARILRVLPVLALLAITVLGLSGRWTDPWLLTYLAAWSLLILYGVASIGEDLARERFSPPQPGADRVPLHFIRLAAAGHLILGTLDYGRWHLLNVPPALQIVGLVGMVVFTILVFRSMFTNHYFSAVVRIQTERGHRVVDHGPYAVVRHPGYAGMILAVPCSGLALGSWLAVACGLVYSALILRRVSFEDSFLQSNLAGYAEYRSRVRYKLIPGVW
jgi:protein-S-isoprenylcysteine O-methyltransferase Ste14